MTLSYFQPDRLLARFFFILFTGAAVFSVMLMMLIAVAGPAQAARQDRGYSRDAIQRMVIQEANANGVVPVALALAVARVESNFQAHVESSAGARGVMQIMPATAWGEFRVPADRLWDPQVNIRLGVDYLERLYRQYGRRWDLALSHYNGGTLKGRGARAIPHGYTRKYVADVTRHWRKFERSRLVLALSETEERVREAETKTQRRTQSIYDTPDAYRLLEEPGVDRGWRDYLAASERILAGEATGEDYAITDNDTDGQNLRRRFRNSLGRKYRFLTPSHGGSGRFM